MGDSGRDRAPHLVAGPIVRGSELIPQLDSPRDPRRVAATRAFFLIASGLFMKVVIANSLATDIVDPVFASPGQYASLDVLVGVYGYSVQIFADFLGYTNIAIGIALLLGFPVGEDRRAARERAADRRVDPEAALLALGSCASMTESPSA